MPSCARTPEQSHATNTRHISNTPTVEQLFQAAFHGARDPRSPQYKAGVRSALAFRIEGKPIVREYDPASAQDDAFSAGMVEGHALYRAAVEKVGGAA